MYEITEGLSVGDEIIISDMSHYYKAEEVKTQMTMPDESL